MLIKDFDVDGFLRDYWQKKPLLIKNPWKNWQNPMAPDELAGLACEQDVESRLIVKTENEWNVENGPLPVSRFDELGDDDWTLLVQAVDHYVSKVAALIEPFRFIPNWRIDDVMVSFAADGGGAGPHFDQYDVFLVQGSGKRLWQIGSICDEGSDLLPHNDLRLLADFEAIEEWVSEPGDILYVPPGVSHNGVAIGNDCMTYSIGFRSPSRSELIGYWVDDMLSEISDDDRYGDPALQEQVNPGEISAEAIDHLHAMITEKTSNRAAFAQWFGQFSSTPKYPDVDWRPEEPLSIEKLIETISAGNSISRNPASRFSFIQHGTELLSLFVDGHCFKCSEQAAKFAQKICAHASFAINHDLLSSDDTMSLIAALYNQGSIFIDLD